MPHTLSVILTSGEEVLPDTFVEADGFVREVDCAGVTRLAVVPSRGVLLSPAGDRMAHTQTPLDEKLVDGHVTAGFRVYLWSSIRRRQRRWLGRDVRGRRERRSSPS